MLVFVWLDLLTMVTKWYYLTWCNKLLPKVDKPKEYIKDWLNAVYKIVFESFAAIDLGKKIFR